MNKRSVPVRSMTAAVLLAGILILITGCNTMRVYGHYHSPGPPVYKKTQPGPPPHAPAHGYRAKQQYQYRYYPSTQVYFDITRKYYFYQVGGRWQKSTRLPVTYHIRHDQYVTIRMETDKPYKKHARVSKAPPPDRRRNPGQHPQSRNPGRMNERGRGR